MSRVEALKEYKELLDTGVITQEEYNAKKQVLLTQPEQKSAPQGATSIDTYMKAVTAVPSATDVVGTKSKMAAGLLGIFLGGLGIHNFYLGNREKAVIQLILGIVGILTYLFIVGIFIWLGVAIWGFVEGILIIISQKGSKWHLDADGNELMD